MHTARSIQIMKALRSPQPVQSFGGKLIAGAALILLLCMLLFLIGSWLLLGFYTQRATKSNAHTHLMLTTSTYLAQDAQLVQALEDTNDGRMETATLKQDPATTLQLLHQTSTTILARYGLTLSHISVVLPTHQFLTQLAYRSAPYTRLTPITRQLVDKSLQGHVAEAFQQEPTASPASQSLLWELQIALPIQQAHHSPVGVLLASRPINNTFVDKLTQQSDATVLLCLSDRVQAMSGTNVKGISFKQLSSDTCQGQSLTIGDIHYFMLSSPMSTNHLLPSSPRLTIVDIESPAAINLHNKQLLLLFVGMTLSLFALGTILFALLAYIFFVHPLQKLQTQVRRVVAEDTGILLPPKDELQTISNSFRLLSQSLESESKAMTEQLGNVLIVSDALISTLDLEQLLGEIVARLGRIMQTKHVSLLLYGREMLSPWAVAQWSQPVQAEETVSSSANAQDAASPHISSRQASTQQEAVTVHADPNSDVTMAATTKMAAISASASAKRHAVRSSTTGQQTSAGQSAQSTYGLRRPRIPRVALRDLDMTLARMVIKRRKIAYAEDVEQIHRGTPKGWARMAFEAGYRSVMAVPLLSREQAIGAIMLYSDMPSEISSRDTFLLSTAAIQASMAIQNALLFAEIKEKNAELERVNNLKSQFLANVTHELRSPLHSIIGYGSMIVDGFVEGDLTPQQEEDIRFIVRRAEDLSQLVDDMLDLSKIEADRIEINLERLHLTDCLADIINQYKLMANEKKLYLNLSIEEQLPLVLADSHRLKQIVTNLVSNALKFTKEGGVTIRCARTRHGEMVRIAVEDTGIGISPAALGFIFDAFRQADGSTTRQFGGTGLGLTIAKRLIELQGGEITVESVVEHGSTFSLILPVVPIAPVASDTPAHSVTVSS